MYMSFSSFQHLHSQNDTNQEIFKKSVEPLIDFCLAGYNTCFIVSGESGSGKTFTVAGDTANSASAGILPLLLHQLFNKIGNGKH